MKKYDSFDIELGRLLANSRKAKHISQRALADLVGIPRGTIATWELGKASIPMKQFIKLCDALGVNYGTLSDIAWESTRETR